MRISRRMANEVGISAEQLQQLMTCSPSPKKIKRKKSLNSTFDTDAKCSSMKDEKENLDGVKRLMDDSSMSHQLYKKNNCERRCVSVKNDVNVYVPRLKLKSKDQNLQSAETKSGTILGKIDNKDSHKRRRRWRVCITSSFSYSSL